MYDGPFFTNSLLVKSLPSRRRYIEMDAGLKCVSKLGEAPVKRCRWGNGRVGDQLKRWRVWGKGFSLVCLNLLELLLLTKGVFFYKWMCLWGVVIQGGNRTGLKRSSQYYLICPSPSWPERRRPNFYLFLKWFKPNYQHTRVHPPQRMRFYKVYIMLFKGKVWLHIWYYIDVLQQRY